MPVVRNTVGVSDVTRFRPLWEDLAQELRTPREFGQPMVSEEEFPRTGLVGVTAIWDRWDGRTDLERPAIIKKAYEAAGRDDIVGRLAFAVGYTVPEAVSAGLLPFRVVPLFKRTDPPEWDEACLRAMIDLGASTLADPRKPVLGFQSLDQADACRRELMKRVPGAENVWSVCQELPS
jgi:hypothetical protein